ncbi:sialic acid-binding protein [Deltaproteobacteria bacterium]|nr:sialic acid-binding protein [Deltaproteobacteria bacterium]
MKRFTGIFFCLACAITMVLTVGGTPAQAAEKPIIMKLANANPAGDIKDRVALKMAEIAKQKTNGRVIVEVYSGGQLGDWRDAVEGLGMGMNEIVLESLGALDAYDERANIDAVPYLYRDVEHFNKMWYGPMGEKILTTVGDAAGFKILGPMNRGARIVTSKVPFKNLAELKGLKIRAPNIQVYIETWKTLGAAPTPLALTETFTAIQQNTVVAQENPTIESYGHSFYDVCKYLIETNHVFSADMFIFSKKYFDGLPADIQKAMIESINEAAQWRNNETRNIEADYKKKFQEKGVTIIEPDRAEFMAAFDGFVEKLFPKLVGWTNEIRAIK